MVTIYFTGGGNIAELPSATLVEAETFPGGINGLACYDAEGKIVGRFKAGEVAGYTFGDKPPEWAP